MTMATVHDTEWHGFHSSFDNTPVRKLKAGDVIVERNPKGEVVNRAAVTAVPSSCSVVKFHVNVKGGKTWCYDIDAVVETE